MPGPLPSGSIGYVIGLQYSAVAWSQHGCGQFNGVQHGPARVCPYCDSGLKRHIRDLFNCLSMKLSLAFAEVIWGHQ